MKINKNISQNLTADEKEVFSIVNNVIKNKSPSTQAFAVGGWTRDKLLGIESNDIDIMIDNVTGEDFAKMVTLYLNTKDPHTIRSNPEKSKFITTAKAYIPLSSGKTQEIDFAQARQEVYNENSRIPVLKSATPQEDAFRRDLTINSLFFRINDFQLIDFTGKGISDLENDIIRTPENPIKTFTDDPLRVFRVARFAAKYKGKIDPETYSAMSDPNLRSIIKTKVSRERIGAEIAKMLSNPNPEYAISILKDTGLFDDILKEAVKGTEYETGLHPSLDMPQNNAHHTLNLWGHTMEVVKNVVSKYKDLDKERRIVMVLAALMHDLGKMCLKIQATNKTGGTSYHGHEDESAKIVPLILKYLKLEPYIQEVSNLVANHMKLHHRERSDAGIRSLRKFIRNMGELSLNWLDVFNLTVADAYSKSTTVDQETIEQYQDLEQQLKTAIESMPQSVSKDNKTAPVLNGNEIMEAFNNRKPGSWIKTVMGFLLELQDQDPNISKDEAKQRAIESFPNFFIKTTIASHCSEFLIKSTLERINSVIKEKPLEAVSLAQDLFEKYKQDDTAVLLCLKTYIKAKTIDNNVSIENNVISESKKMANKNFLVPDFISSYVIAKVLNGQKINSDDERFMTRALKMSCEKTARSIKDILPIIKNKNTTNYLTKLIKT